MARLPTTSSRLCAATAAFATLVLLGSAVACQEARPLPDGAHSLQETVPSTAARSATPIAVSRNQQIPAIQATQFASPGPQGQDILVEYPKTMAVIPPHGTVNFAPARGTPAPAPTPGDGGSLRVQSLADQPANLTYDFAMASHPARLTIAAAPGQAVTIVEGPTNDPTQNCVIVAKQINDVQCVAGLRSSLTFTIVSADRVAPATSTFRYPSGWNLIASPDNSPLLADLQLVYLVDKMPRSQGSQGLSIATGTMLPRLAMYWTYFSDARTISLTDAPAEMFSYSIGQNDLTPVGNATNRPAQVTGVGTLVVYDPTTATYQETTTLAPGQAGWVYSSQDGTVTVSTVFQ